MTTKTRIVVTVDDPRSARSLVPMLVAGLVMGVIGMIIAIVVS
jgi:hypothetical protein